MIARGRITNTGWRLDVTTILLSNLWSPGQLSSLGKTLYVV